MSALSTGNRKNGARVDAMRTWIRAACKETRLVRYPYFSFGTSTRLVRLADRHLPINWLCTTVRRSNQFVCLYLLAVALCITTLQGCLDNSKDQASEASVAGDDPNHRMAITPQTSGLNEELALPAATAEPQPASAVFSEPDYARSIERALPFTEFNASLGADDLALAAEAVALRFWSNLIRQTSEELALPIVQRAQVASEPNRIRFRIESSVRDGDDAITREWLDVMLDRQASAGEPGWRITSATWWSECARGKSDDGLCL